MDLPDYTQAAAFLGVICQGHNGQHRCTDGAYYSPSNAPSCPVNGQADAVLAVLDAAQQINHVACHDTEHVDLVMLGMTGLVAGDLEAEDRDAWRTSVRNALETHAALLDPSVES